MIPKKIHYCWFSGKPIPKEFQKYIETWKKHCPDYEIIRWDESNYDISKNEYMKAAYREKRWGFVPDYARFDIIYREGGIYLDTDVELVKSFDELLDNPCFLGFETERDINAGLGFGAEQGNEVIRQLRDMYDKISFYRKDGSLNLTPSPKYISEKLESLGIQRKNQYQELENVTVYPRDYFGAKDYYTEKINRTENTYSIHHFSCTWMSREEKRAEERRRRFCARFGNMLGNRVDGCYKRLAPVLWERKIRAVQALPFSERWKEHFDYSERKNEKRLELFVPAGEDRKKSQNSIVLWTPALDTINLGDHIIEEACFRQLDFIREETITKVSTHRYPNESQTDRMKESGLILVAGSNLLSSNMHHSQWKLPSDYQAMEQICLLGCGCSSYEEFHKFSKLFYKKILCGNWIHSVRDRYTKEKLRALGIENVLYTGCPSMWGLTPQHCRDIPAEKGREVVTSLTFYQADRQRDEYQMKLLFELYDTVYFWPQSVEDEQYVRQLLLADEKERVVILKRDLNELRRVFQEKKPDYVGNRLHAGIMALQHGCRSLIIAIDNRAVEIAKDTRLPIVDRKNLDTKLEQMVCEKYQTEIELPWENISIWKQQFMRD